MHRSVVKSLLALLSVATLAGCGMVVDPHAPGRIFVLEALGGFTLPAERLPGETVLADTLDFTVIGEDHGMHAVGWYSTTRAPDGTVSHRHASIWYVVSDRTLHFNCGIGALCVRNLPATGRIQSEGLVVGYYDESLVSAIYIAVR
jgi:hypothetical protein